MTPSERTGLIFGTAGAPASSKQPTTEAGIERVAELGLGCMEVQFARGVKMNEGVARRVGEVAKKGGVRLTVHAPYYINLNSHEEEKVIASWGRLMQSARIASLLGAEGVVFHAAFYLGDSPQAVYATVKSSLGERVRQLRTEGIHVWLRPEVTGKPSQFGTMDEVLSLSAEVEGVAPCVDFAHWHARTGRFNSYDEFVAMIQKIEEKLGRQGLDNMHIHISGVQYGGHGEIKHLNLEQSDFHFIEFLKALKALEVKGLVICESPDREGDALLLQQAYSAL